MRKHFLLFFLLIIAVVANSQPRVHLGVTTAFNSTFVLDNGLKQDPRYISEFTYEWAPIGFSAGIDITKKFGLSMEAIKAAQGQIYQVIDAYETVVGERRIDLDMIQLPFFMKLMSGGDAATRFNFQMGPQLNLLNSGVEYIQYAASTQSIPDGVTIPDGATQNPDGTYNVPDMPYTELLSTAAEEEIQKFKNKELQLAMAMGLTIDIAKNFYLDTNVRASYSFTDLRNEDLIVMIKDGSVTDIFSRRANLVVGIQFGFHWMIGGTRSFKAREKRVLDELGYGYTE